MLIEAIESVFTQCPHPWRRLGYAYAAVACVARARRCAVAWTPHLERSRAEVMAAVADCASRRTALVLGAGPTLDIPLAALAEGFQRVILADIAHTLPARIAARRHANVVLATVDLTGLADALADRRVPSLPAPGCDAFLDDPEIDLVVSANVLSQLPLIPVAASLKRWPSMDGEALGRTIVAAHLTHLRGFRCPTLLLTDVVRAVFDAENRPLSQDEALFGVPLPDGPEWEWDVAPPGEVRGGRSVMTRVRAVRLDRS